MKRDGSGMDLSTSDRHDRKVFMPCRCRGGGELCADHNLLLSVRGGGHNVSGSAVCDGGLVIDLSEMRAVRVDRKTNSVHVQGGATLADIDRETQPLGLPRQRAMFLQLVSEALPSAVDG